MGSRKGRGLKKREFALSALCDNYCQACYLSTILGEHIHQTDILLSNKSIPPIMWSILMTPDARKLSTSFFQNNGVKRFIFLQIRCHRLRNCLQIHRIHCPHLRNCLGNFQTRSRSHRSFRQLLGRHRDSSLSVHPSIAAVIANRCCVSKPKYL